MEPILGVQLAALQRGALFHASAIQASSGSGLVFAGDSGKGKSTTAQLWVEHARTAMLGDECIAIFQHDGAFWVQGTAWHGRYKNLSPAKAPVKSLFVLEHAGANHAQPLRPAQAVASLLPRIYLPFWDRALMDRTLAFLDDLCSAVPCYRFGFVPDHSAVEYVQCLIAS